MAASRQGSMAGLFAGIGGLELGLARHGWTCELLCEIDPAARAVLAARFPDVPRHPDVTALRALPAGIDLLAAGFPCQDLSQAGRTAGIGGARSGLVDEVFRLIARRSGPRWLLVENVPFMLQLDRGAAMRHITDALGRLGYAWAYRVVDARAFGLPQRRKRVLMLASRTEDPRAVLFAEDTLPDPASPSDRHPCGFYWTEGVRGLGWAVNAVPTLKGGSAIGIPSPPAVWLPSGGIVTPAITAAERLQGFSPGWTEPATTAPGVRAGHRWKLVGNAVSVRMAEWIGGRLAAPCPGLGTLDRDPLRPGDRWPDAAWGTGESAYRVDVSDRPVQLPYEDLAGFLEHAQPLSARAAAGFLRRAERGNLRFPPGFLADVAAHRDRMNTATGAADVTPRAPAKGAAA